MTNFYKIKLQKIVKESKEAKIKSFYFSYDKNEFKFKAGQFVKLFPDIKNQPGLFRYMTIASSPTEDFLLFTMRIREESPFKRLMNKFKLGQEAVISRPKGDFVLTKKSSKPIVMIAGGIGLTPFRSMIKYAIDKKRYYRITLIYSCKTPEQIIYKNEWLKFQRKNPNLKIIYTITQPQESKLKWRGSVGRINKELIKRHISDFSESIFYICGSLEMVSDIISILRKIGFKRKHIKTEAFTA